MIWSDLKSLSTKFIHRKDIDWSMMQVLARDEIAQRLIVQENESVAFLTPLSIPQVGLFSIGLPSDYARMRSVAQGGNDYNPVTMKALTGPQCPALVYGISGGKFWTKGTGEFVLIYSMRGELVTEEAGTNPVMDKYSGVYLYGMLKHAGILAQDFDSTGAYEAGFSAAVEDANTLYMDAAFGAGAQPTVQGGIV